MEDLKEIGVGEGRGILLHCYADAQNDLIGQQWIPTQQVTVGECAKADQDSREFSALHRVNESEDPHATSAAGALQNV